MDQDSFRICRRVRNVFLKRKLMCTRASFDKSYSFALFLVFHLVSHNVLELAKTTQSLLPFLSRPPFHCGLHLISAWAHLEIPSTSHITLDTLAISLFPATSTDQVSVQDCVCRTLKGQLRDQVGVEIQPPLHNSS